MQNKGRVLAILMAVTVAMPVAARAESIRDAAVREVAAVRLAQPQAAPVIQQSGRPGRLLPILIGAGVGCGAVAVPVLLMGDGGRGHFALRGCAGGAVYGAVIGFIVSAR